MRSVSVSPKRLALRSFALALSIALDALVVSACSEIEEPPDRPSASADAGATQGDGSVAPDGSDLDAGPGPSGGHSFELTIRVGNRQGVMAGGALVRVDGADGSLVEGAADAEGTFVASLDPNGAPWDVTVASEEYGTATTILGVTGPIEGTIHLFGPRSAMDPTHTLPLTGAVTGLSDGAFSLQLLGPTVFGIIYSRVSSTYTATLFDTGDASPLRLLALEVPGSSPTPTNGVWLDVDRGESLSGIDIDLPVTPPERIARELTVQLPTQGALDASGFELESGTAHVLEHEFEYTTGTVSAISRGAGHFACTVDALGGALAPTDVMLRFVGDGGEVIAEVSAETEDVVTVPAAEELSVEGNSLDEARFSARAAGYTHVGASLKGPGEGTVWFVYSYGAGEIEDQRWPRLHSRMPLADVLSGPIGSTEDGAIHVFAISREDGSPPWDWRRVHRDRAVIVSKPVAVTGR